MNFMMLSSVLGSVMSVVGAAYKLVSIMEYVPQIKSTGGKEPEESHGEIIL